jgi:hypothetical protein
MLETFADPAVTLGVGSFDPAEMTFELLSVSPSMLLRFTGCALRALLLLLAMETYSCL